jgi:hypothetical protein
MDSDDLKLLFDSESLFAVISLVNVNNSRSISRIFNHFLWEDSELTEKVLLALLKGCSELDFDEIESFLISASMFMQIGDSLQNRRIELFLTEFLARTEKNSSFWKVTDISIDYICKMAHENELVYRFLHEKKRLIDWIPNWLFSNSRPPLLQTMGKIQLVRPKTKEEKASFLKYCENILENHFGMHFSEKRDVVRLIIEGKDIKSAMNDTEKTRAERKFVSGMLIECESRSGSWCKAKVIALDSNSVKVAFEGYSNLLDEWIPRGSKRLRIIAQN